MRAVTMELLKPLSQNTNTEASVVSSSRLSVWFGGAALPATWSEEVASERQPTSSLLQVEEFARSLEAVREEVKALGQGGVAPPQADSQAPDQPRTFVDGKALDGLTLELKMYVDSKVEEYHTQVLDKLEQIRSETTPQVA